MPINNTLPSNCKKMGMTILRAKLHIAFSKGSGAEAHSEVVCMQEPDSDQVWKEET